MYCICKNLNERTQSTRSLYRFTLTLCVNFFYIFLRIKDKGLYNERLQKI